MDGRISELSDDILSFILTMLSVKDLLRTSILSKRWYKLWALRRDLFFDISLLGSTEDELLESRYLTDVPHSPTMNRRVVNLDTSRDEFVKRVNQFVMNFPGTKIDSFLVNFCLDCEKGNTIDQWISFVIARGVERINLLFLGEPYGHDAPQSKHYTFDFGLFSATNASTLNHLHLQCCLVCYHTKCDFIPFKNLRFLSLESVKLDEMFIESLLSNCRRLEELCLIFCEFKSSMPKIISSSLCLLKVTRCYFVSNNIQVNLNSILVDCLKLTSLQYHGYDLDSLVYYPTKCHFIPFKNLRLLSLECVKLDEMFVESLLSNCRCLEELCLIFCEFKSSIPKIISSSLCHLKVTRCYYVSNNILVNLNLILVDCLKLTSLQYRGYDLDALNINTPMLKCIYFIISLKDLNKFVALCATFPELKILHVGTSLTVTPSLQITQPLKHLKKLNLVISCPYSLNDMEYDPMWILNFIQASPLLQKLSIKFTNPEFLKNQKDIRDVETFSHDEVKVIELRGCVGNWFEIEFVMNVLKHAHKLEQIIVMSTTCDCGERERMRERMSDKLQSLAGLEKLVFM